MALVNLFLLIFLLHFFLEESVTDSLDEKWMPSSQFSHQPDLCLCKRKTRSRCRNANEVDSFDRGKRLKGIIIEDVEKWRPFNTTMAYIVERGHRSGDIGYTAPARLGTQKAKEIGAEMLILRDLIERIEQQNREKAISDNLI